MEISLPATEFAERRVFGQENDEAGRVGKYTGLVNRVSPVGSEVDWVEPCLEVQLDGRGVERVYDAFHLLQTDPSVQVTFTIRSFIFKDIVKMAIRKRNG